jgi:hypothetical protein
MVVDGSHTGRQKINHRVGPGGLLIKKHLELWRLLESIDPVCHAVIRIEPLLITTERGAGPLLQLHTHPVDEINTTTMKTVRYVSSHRR